MKKKGYLVRYNNLGGIRSVISRYEKGGVTLTEIGRVVGCSTQTVLNDIVREIGYDNYSNLRKRRSPPIEEDKLLDVKTAQTFISKRIAAMRGKETDKLKTLLSVLCQAEKEKVRLEILAKGSGRFQVYLSHKAPIDVRVAILDETQREHKRGLHRFKVSPTITFYAFAIFAIKGKNKSVVYIFPTTEINHLKTLALRYKFFERKSKYDYARDNWRAIKMHCQVSAERQIT